MPRQTGPRHQLRFGIGEWYGRLFDQLMPTERQFDASIQSLPKSQRPPQGCPFQSSPGRPVTCGKPGGVCSLRLYRKEGATGDVNRAPDENPRTLCPKRFQEDCTILTI